MELQLPTMSRQAWVSRCTRALGRMCPDADPESCYTVAAVLWHDAHSLPPEEAARIERESWAHLE